MAKRERPIDRLRGYQPRGIERFMAGERYFSPADVDAILKCVRKPLPNSRVDHETVEDNRLVIVQADRREALVERLELIAHTWAFEANRQTKPRPRVETKALQRIVLTANDLLESLGLVPDGKPEELPYAIELALRSHAVIWCQNHGNLGRFEIFRSGQRRDQYTDSIAAASAVRAAVEGVAKLRDWANMAADRRRIAAVNSQRRGRPPDEATNELISNLVGIWRAIWETEPRTSVGGEFSKSRGKPGGPFFRFCRTVTDKLPMQPSLSDEALRDRIRTVLGKRGRKGKMKGNVS